jgi:hypothetical protein
MSILRGRTILQPIVVCWWIVAAKAPQKCVGSCGLCVGFKALEGGAVVGP